MVLVQNAIIVGTSVAGMFKLALTMWTLRVRSVISIKADGTNVGCDPFGRPLLVICTLCHKIYGKPSK